MDRTASFRFAADLLYNLLHDKSKAGDKSATSERAESNGLTLTTLQQIKVGLMDFKPMLARYCYILCLSVCLSITSWCCFETYGLIEPGFGVEVSFAVSCTMSTKQGYFSLELCPKIWTANVAIHGTSVVATCYQLSSIKADDGSDKRDRRRPTKLTTPARVDG